ncbi:hypothetical protein VH441_04820 [Psychrobacter sp. HD31]|uniref:hypothetical protein n=1 Tax=Psychrobacter sp. HD31 TaxID=3112003 RepID=UPI003DA398F5
MKKSLLLTLFLGISFTTQANVNRLDSTQHYPVKSVIKQLNKKGWDKSIVTLQNPDDFGFENVSIIYTLPPINSQTLFTRFNGQKLLVRDNSTTIKVDGKTVQHKESKVYSEPGSYDWVGYYNSNNDYKIIITNRTPIPQTATVGSSQSMYQSKGTKHGEPNETSTGRWELKPSTKNSGNNTPTAQLCLYHDTVSITTSIEDTTAEKQSLCYTIDTQGNVLDETIEIISYSENNGEPPMVFKTPTSNQ